MSGRKQVEACITNLVILYCKIWKQESKLTLNEYDITCLPKDSLKYLNKLFKDPIKASSDL